jgi:hypothetical protein
LPLQASMLLVSPAVGSPSGSSRSRTWSNEAHVATIACARGIEMRP